MDKLNVILTGATGMVGKGVLYECLESTHVNSVLMINRHSLGITHTKLKEIIHSDFLDFNAIKHHLEGYNTCFFCLGVSAAGMKETAYKRLTYDLTLHVAQTLLEQNTGMTFCYVSGTGTDSTEKSRMMWARVKGKTENDLLKMGFKDAYMFRPAFIQPTKGIRSRTRAYNIFYFILKPFYPILKVFKGFVTNSSAMGKAMIVAASKGAEKKVLENRDINLLAYQYQ